MKVDLIKWQLPLLKLSILLWLESSTVQRKLSLIAGYFRSHLWNRPQNNLEKESLWQQRPQAGRRAQLLSSVHTDWYGKSHYQSSVTTEHCDHRLRAHCATSVFAISLDLASTALQAWIWYVEKQTHLWQHTNHHLYCPETWKQTLPSSTPPPPAAAAKKLTEESVPPHRAPTIRVLTGVCVRSDYTLATTNTSTL